MLRSWLRRYCLQPHDIDDLVQQVLAVAVRELPHFHFDPRQGTFRGWLRNVTANRLREFWRTHRRQTLATGPSGFKDRLLNQLVNHRNDPDRVSEREHAKQIVQSLLTRIRADFSPKTWLAFQRVMSGEKAAAVAADLKISVNAVYLAKSSVLRRLRQELRGLAD